jgi:hypothetical protein
VDFCFLGVGCQEVGRRSGMCWGWVLDWREGPKHSSSRQGKGFYSSELIVGKNEAASAAAAAAWLRTITQTQS